MSAEEKEARKQFDLALARIDEKLDDMKDGIEQVKEALADKSRDLEELVKRVETYQKNTLEPNQQTIYKELLEIGKTKGKPEQTENE